MNEENISMSASNADAIDKVRNRHQVVEPLHAQKGTKGHKERGEAPSKCSASLRCSAKAIIYFSGTLFPVTSYISPLRSM